MSRIDFRLWRIPAELAVLKRYLELVEEHIVESRNKAERVRKRKIKETMSRLSDEDLADPASDGWAELDLISQEYDLEVDFIQPRMIRGPSLVPLFSVYETAVIEVADWIHGRRGDKRSIEDIKGLRRGFLSQSKEYYKTHLPFGISSSNDHWERLTVLSDLRNIIAHTNGHLDEDCKERFEDIKEKTIKFLGKPGVYKKYDCILVSADLLGELFLAVEAELEGLVARY